LLANKKLMFHSCLLEGMDRIAHCAQEGGGRGRIICRNDRGRRQQAWASCHNIALTSLKRLVERQTVIKRVQAGMPSERSITIALCIEASAIRFTYSSGAHQASSKSRRDLAHQVQL
jgi:hypothetical protein